MGTTRYTSSNKHQLKHMELHLNTRKHFLTVRVIKHWNGVPKEAVESPSLQIFKTQLDIALGYLL